MDIPSPNQHLFSSCCWVLLGTEELMGTLKYITLWL